MSDQDKKFRQLMNLKNPEMRIADRDCLDDIWKNFPEQMSSDAELVKPCLESDLLNTDWVLDKARARQDYAQNVYAALCNTKWQKLEILEILKDQTWSCSWRHAGGIVSDMRQAGDYMDWYCSGMGGMADYDTAAAEKFMKQHKFVPEGAVTDEIAADFRQLGWALKKS